MRERRENDNGNMNEELGKWENDEKNEEGTYSSGGTRAW